MMNEPMIEGTGLYLLIQHGTKLEKLPVLGSAIVPMVIPLQSVRIEFCNLQNHSHPATVCVKSYRFKTVWPWPKVMDWFKDLAKADDDDGRCA
jgi:hypothetical protein